MHFPCFTVAVGLVTSEPRSGLKTDNYAVFLAVHTAMHPVHEQGGFHWLAGTLKKRLFLSGK